MENKPDIVNNNSNNPLKNIERLSNLLDNKFKVPGTEFTFGIDPLLNLIPVLGDYIGFAFGSFLIIEGIRKGAKGKVILKMILNNFIDFLVGLIPGLGQIFDFFYKSNQKNVQLLREYFNEGKHQGNATVYWILIIGSIIALLVLVVYLFYRLIQFFNYLLVLLTN